MANNKIKGQDILKGLLIGASGFASGIADNINRRNQAERETADRLNYLRQSEDIRTENNIREANAKEALKMQGTERAYNTLSSMLSPRLQGKDDVSTGNLIGRKLYNPLKSDNEETVNNNRMQLSLLDDIYGTSTGKVYDESLKNARPVDKTKKKWDEPFIYTEDEQGNRVPMTDENGKPVSNPYYEKKTKGTMEVNKGGMLYHRILYEDGSFADYNTGKIYKAPGEKEDKPEYKNDNEALQDIDLSIGEMLRDQTTTSRLGLDLAVQTDDSQRNQIRGEINAISSVTKAKAKKAENKLKAYVSQRNPTLGTLINNFEASHGTTGNLDVPAFVEDLRRGYKAGAYNDNDIQFVNRYLTLKTGKKAKINFKQGK